MRRWILLLAALALMLSTARLGWWQLDRAAQKTALQRTLDSRRSLPPLAADELARDATALDAQLHRSVRLKGRWHDEATVALENRQMNGRPGFFIVTPLVLADGRAVLVQRGWLPRDFQDRTKVSPPPLPTGEVELMGRVALAPSRLYDFDGAASAPPSRVRQNLDLGAFARETRLPLLPLSVLQTVGDHDTAGVRSPEVPGVTLLRDWPAPAVDVAKHHGYAFQWFALCTLTLILTCWFQFVAPRRRARAHDERQA